MEKMTTAGLTLLRDGYLTFLILLSGVILLAVVGKCRPSRRTFGLILLPVPLLFLGFWWRGLDLFVLIYNPLLLMTLLVDRFLLSVDPAQLSANRLLPRQFGLGRSYPVELVVTNNSPDAVDAVIFDDTPLSMTTENDKSRSPEIQVRLAPYETRQVVYAVLPTCRGKQMFGKIHVRYKSRLGLLWLQTRLGRGEVARVLPDFKRIRDLQVKYARGQVSGSVMKRYMGLEGTQFDGLRGYDTGDDIRKMDWKASARLDEPVVRVFSHEVEQPVMLLLDAGRKMGLPVKGSRISKLDWALNASLAFAGVALGRGDQVGAMAFSNRILRDVPFGKGRKHLQNIMGTLAELEPEPMEPAYDEVVLYAARMLKRRSLVVMLTDLIDPAASRRLLASLSALARHHLVMVVTFRDTALVEVAEGLPQDGHEAYLKGVCLDLLMEREQTLGRLASSRNIVTIDTLPAQMDEALIHQYLATKFRNRL